MNHLQLDISSVVEEVLLFKICDEIHSQRANVKEATFLSLCTPSSINDPENTSFINQPCLSWKKLLIEFREK